jgi:hypothetical protein
MRLHLSASGNDPLLDSICDEVFFGQVAHLAMQLDAVTGDRPRVLDQNGLTIEFKVFIEGYLVALDGAVGNLS